MEVAALRGEAFGATALLIRCAGSQAAVVAERARARWPAAHDVVPAADSVLVDGIEEIAAAIEEVSAWVVDAAVSASPRLVELDTRYDGPDLQDIARLWQVDPDEAVEIHASQIYRVMFCGFAPGFAYCTGLPDQFAVPRRASPRARVEPGSVALAGGYTGVYPTASPGGWQVIGHTSAALWDLSRDEPALLTPGTSVRFVPR